MTEPESETSSRSGLNAIESPVIGPESSSPTMRQDSSDSSETESHSRTFVAGYSCPLPPPGLLEDFGRVNPTFPERIVAMAEQERQHRHQLENRAIDAEVWSREQTHLERQQALIAAVGIFVALLVAGVWVALSAHAGAGVAIITTGVAAIPAAIWWNKHSKQTATHEPGQEKDF